MHGEFETSIEGEVLRLRSWTRDLMEVRPVVKEDMVYVIAKREKELNVVLLLAVCCKLRGIWRKRGPFPDCSTCKSVLFSENKVSLSWLQ